MATRAPRYLSNTEKNLKIGVSNYSEDKVSLEVIGLVGIGSTTPTDILDVQGTTKSKGLNITGVSTFNNDVQFKGGAGTTNPYSSGTGGPGAVILRFPSAATISVSPGTNATATHPGGDKIATFTVSGNVCVSF